MPYLRLKKVQVHRSDTAKNLIGGTRVLNGLEEDEHRLLRVGCLEDGDELLVTAARFCE